MKVNGFSGQDHARIGIVAIGRNEGDRLHTCLRSLVAPGRIVVYVDSGSSDGSVEFARSLGVEVVELDTSIDFTAARARNAGFARLQSIQPELEFVQFIDGDCELAEGWLESAIEFLARHTVYAVACGRCRELEPNRNVYHRLADIEWNTPVGDAKSCGGNALYRVSAFRAAAGFLDSLVAGEEPELCVRLRQMGFRVRRLGVEMVRHDIRMTSWRQWWRRAVRSGRAYADVARLHGAPPERHWTKERRSIVIWGGVVPLFTLLLAWPTRG